MLARAVWLGADWTLLSSVFHVTRKQTAAFVFVSKTKEIWLEDRNPKGVPFYCMHLNIALVI